MNLLNRKMSVRVSITVLVITILLVSVVIIFADSPVALYGGVLFPPGTIKVDGALTSPLKITITGVANGKLVPTEDSMIPVLEQYNPYSGEFKRELYTHAANVTWKFVKKGITFEAEDGTYVTEKDGATIRFTKGGVKMNGVKKVKNAKKAVKEEAPAETPAK